MPLLPVEQIEQFAPVFKGKFGNVVVRVLRKILSIKTLSDLYDTIDEYQGPDFAGALLDRLGVNYHLGGSQRLLNLPDGPFITVSNHPYGGMDGVILIDLIGHLRPDFKVMVTEFLALVEALRPSLIVVNPKNNLNKGITAKNIQGVREVLERLHDGKPIGFFPSGAVSDLSLKEMKIRDREWQEPVLRLIQKAKVPIVPVRFFDHNSMWFYYLGLIDWRIRLMQLPHELVNKKHRRIRVGVGEILTVEEQEKHPDIKDYGTFLRSKVYDMPIPDDFIRYKDFIAATRQFTDISGNVIT